MAQKSLANDSFLSWLDKYVWLTIWDNKSILHKYAHTHTHIPNLIADSWGRKKMCVLIKIKQENRGEWVIDKEIGSEI